MSKFKGTKGPFKVVHSESKNAFNIIGTIIGGKHKIARIPYEKIEDPGYSKVNKSWHDEAKADALILSKSYDMLEKLKKAKTEISRLKGSIMAHPDCTEGSEFDDRTTSAQQIEDEIELLIKEATEV